LLHIEQLDIFDSISNVLETDGTDIYIVGGFIRDTLLNETSNDVDMVVKQDPITLGNKLAQITGGHSYNLSLDHHVRRVEVPVSQGTITIDLSQLCGTIEDNLTSRDFTINSMATPLNSFKSNLWRDSIIDPCNGMSDLRNKTLRCNNSDVFVQDGLRLLRGVRIAAKLKLRIDPYTANVMKSNARHIELAAPERVRDEFLTILSATSAHNQLEILDRLDILCRIIPELSDTKGVEQPKVHYWDVWGHSIHAVETAEMVTSGHHNSAIYSLVPWTQEIESHFNEIITDGHSRRTILKLTALLHDIAKPQTKTTDSTGRTRFLRHSEEGSEIANERLSALRLSRTGIKSVCKMIEEHLRPTNMSYNLDLPTPRAIYRYYRDLEDVAIDTLYLAMADYLAAKGPEIAPDNWAKHAKMIAHILQTGSIQPQNDTKPTRLLTGTDIINELGIQPGPQIGAILEHINESQAAGIIQTKEDALTLAGQYISNLHLRGN
tara:strand:+ start:1086 stop:2561 length:1476 start_codon:yes stop_codon:yes gene_type:complete